MELAEALKDVARNDGHLPRAGVLWCREHWEEASAVMLRRLEDFARGADRSPETMELLSMAIFMMADRRDSRALPILCAIAKQGELLDGILGDHITESLGSVITSLYNGDISPIRSVIECSRSEQFIRSSFLGAHAWLAHSGVCDMAEFRQWLFELPGRMYPQSDCFIWCEWAREAILLGDARAMPMIRKMYADGWIDESFDRLDNLEKEYREAAAGGPREIDYELKRLAPVGDLLQYMSKWYCYSERYRKDIKSEKPQSGEDWLKQAAEILVALKQDTASVPSEMWSKASRKWDSIKLALHHALKDWGENEPGQRRTNSFIARHALLLCAQERDFSAAPLFVAITRNGVAAAEIFGEALPVVLPRIATSLCASEIPALRAVIAGASTPAPVRAALLKAHAWLALEGETPYSEAAEWHNGLGEFARDYGGELDAAWEECAAFLPAGVEPVPPAGAAEIAARAEFVYRHDPVIRVIETLESDFGVAYKRFNIKEFAEMVRGTLGIANAGNRAHPELPARKTGRNESCPCGSGKKFKKCCLGTAPLALAS